jgi:hypothetical protein
MGNKGEWAVFETSWCTYIKNTETNKIHSVVFKPDGQILHTDHLNVIIHENGLEIVIDQKLVN